MSLEALIADHTAALKENTAAILASNALRETAIGAVKEAAASAPAAKKATAETKKAEVTAPAEETKKAESTAASGSITAEQGEFVKSKIAEYVSGADRADENWAKAEREARKEKVRTLLAHEKVLTPGVTFDPKALQMQAAGFGVFKATIEKFIASGDLTAAPAASADASLDL